MNIFSYFLPGYLPVVVVYRGKRVDQVLLASRDQRFVIMIRLVYVVNHHLSEK